MDEVWPIQRNHHQTGGAAGGSADFFGMKTSFVSSRHQRLLVKPGDLSETRVTRRDT